MLMNSNNQGRGRLIAPTADLSARVPVADKSAVGTINRPLQKVELVHSFVAVHYRALSTSAAMPSLYSQLIRSSA